MVLSAHTSGSYPSGQVARGQADRSRTLSYLRTTRPAPNCSYLLLLKEREQSNGKAKNKEGGNLGSCQQQETLQQSAKQSRDKPPGGPLSRAGAGGADAGMQSSGQARAGSTQPATAETSETPQ